MVLFVVINDYLMLLLCGVFGYMWYLVEMLYWLLIDVFFNSVVDGW